MQSFEKVYSVVKELNQFFALHVFAKDLESILHCDLNTIRTQCFIIHCIYMYLLLKFH